MRIYTWLLLGALIGAAGCEWPQVDSPRQQFLRQKNLVSSRSLAHQHSPLEQFADIPAPEGFLLRPENSRPPETAVPRNGSLAYFGESTVAAVAAFYEEVMPRLGWRRQPTAGPRLLQFEKESERCDLTLRADRGIVYLQVTVAPRP